MTGLPGVLNFWICRERESSIRVTPPHQHAGRRGLALVLKRTRLLLPLGVGNVAIEAEVVDAAQGQVVAQDVEHLRHLRKDERLVAVADERRQQPALRPGRATRNALR